MAGEGKEPGKYATEEQLVYADLLDWGMKIGFIMLVAAFVAYLTGMAAPHVPVEELPKYWTMPVSQYLAAANAPHGWGWVALAGKGDYMNFIGIAFLSAVTIACFARGRPRSGMHSRRPCRPRRSRAAPLPDHGRGIN